MTQVYVDGPDGTGKTGISKWLANELGWPRLEMGPVDDFGCIEEKSAVFNTTLRQLHDAEVDLVVDRGPVSSLVYSEVFERDPTVSGALETIHHVNPVIVWLDVDPGELVMRYEDELFGKRELHELVDTYRGTMEMLDEDEQIEVHRVDTTGGYATFLGDLVAEVQTGGGFLEA